MTINNTTANMDDQQKEPTETSPTDGPMNTWKHMVAFLCVWFLLVALIMVYFTATGSPQAGLLEVGFAAFIFVILFHLVMKYFPRITKIFTSVIVIGFGIALIAINYHFLKVVKKDASLEHLLVGDLLVKKIKKSLEKEPVYIVPEAEISKAPEVPQIEHMLPSVLFEQLKISMPSPVKAGIEPLFIVTEPASAITEGPLIRIDQYVPKISEKGIKNKIAGPVFPVNGCEPLMHEGVYGKDIAYLKLLPLINEAMVMREESIIHSPLSEKGAPVYFITNLKPLKEKRVPID